MNGFRQDYDRLFDLFKSQSFAKSSDNVPNETEVSASSLSQHFETNSRAYNLTFCEFNKCFQQMKFGYVFFLQRNNNALREFFDEVTEFLVNQLSDGLPIETRIFSFYLLYALWYFLQNVFKMSFKIRLSSISYFAIKDLVFKSLNRKQLDLVVAYRKLFRAGAFVFCENIMLYGPYYKEYITKHNYHSVMNPQDISNCFLKLNQDISSYSNQLNLVEAKAKKSFESENLAMLVKKIDENQGI